jgi:hypothetical protein
MATPYNAPLSDDGFTGASAAGGARAPDPWDAPPYDGNIDQWMAAEVRSGRNFSSWLQNPEVAQAYQQYRSGVDASKEAAGLPGRGGGQGRGPGGFGVGDVLDAGLRYLTPAGQAAGAIDLLTGSDLSGTYQDLARGDVGALQGRAQQIAANPGAAVRTATRGIDPIYQGARVTDLLSGRDNAGEWDALATGLYNTAGKAAGLPVGNTGLTSAVAGLGGGAVGRAAGTVADAASGAWNGVVDYLGQPVDPRGGGNLGRPGAGSGDPRLSGGTGGGAGGGGIAPGAETQALRDALSAQQGMGQQVYADQQGLAQQMFDAGRDINLRSPQASAGGQVGAISGAGYNPLMLSTPAQVAQMQEVDRIAGMLGAGPQIAGQGMQVSGQLGAGPQLQGPGITVSGGFGTMGQDSAQQQGFLTRINQFLDTPDGPSIAEAQLRQAQADNAGQLIGAARSGRGGPGAAAQALRGAISEGGAIASDTAGQMATLRAQEQDMRRNRQLAGMTAGGQLAGDIRAGDLSYRGQDLQALMSDQGSRDTRDTANLSAGVATRGQDLQGLISDQGSRDTRDVANLNAGVSYRGQDLQGLMADAANQLSARQANLDAGVTQRGQDVQVGLGNQSAAGQNNALRGNIDVANQGNMVTQRGQDAQVASANADRVARQDAAALQGMANLFSTGVQAQGQGLDFLGQNNQQQLAGQSDLLSYLAQQQANANAELGSARSYDLGLQGIQAGVDPRTRGQAMIDNGISSLIGAGGAYLTGLATPAPPNQGLQDQVQQLQLQRQLQELQRMQQAGGA